MAQTYATHRRFDPAYHYFALPVWLVTLALAIRLLWLHRPGALTIFLGVFVLGYALLSMRMYALKVQDRVIRLEETLRLQRLLPAERHPDIARLAPRQFVALRFAADAELGERFEEALREGLDGEAIKKRIQAWRADEFRV